MTQESNFDRYWRLGMKTITHADELEAYKLILDSGIYLSMEMEKSIPQTDRPAHISDALALFQMTLTKGMTLYQSAHGLNYYNPIGEFSFNRLLDPMSMSSILRSQFEAFTNFHNIYLYHSTDDEHASMLLYDLWVVAGLKERQRFADSKLPDLVISDDIKGNPDFKAEYEAMQVAQAKRREEHEKKIAEEAALIETIIERIHANPIYTELPAEKQQMLDRRIRDREFQLVLVDGELKPLGWRDLFLNAGVKEMFYHLYSSMSLGSHPSNASVFQYEQMFADGSNEVLALSNLRISKILLAFLITDFCIYFPEAETRFQNLPIVAQLIIDGFNVNYRSEEYSLSENRMKFFNDHNEQFTQKLQANQNGR